MTPKADSYFHRGGETPLLGSTIPEHLISIVSRFPDQEAVVSLPQKTRLKYRDFSTQIDLLARGLMALGFKRGDRIGVWSTNDVYAFYRTRSARRPSRE